MRANDGTGEVVFEARDLTISARRADGSLKQIVSGVNFRVHAGEVVAFIGESGSGKTTLALSALGYCKPGLEITGGQACFKGQNLADMPASALRNLRGERVAYLAQSAAATFNPSMTIGEQVTETAIRHGRMTAPEADARALELFRNLGLPEAESIGLWYPHQVSGGQLQRLMAAMALCNKPDLLVLDEPTTALDVTTQIGVLDAFKRAIRHEKAAAIYVSHDLAVVAQVADHVVVLYDGEVREAGPTEVILKDPRHPYTKRLMAAINPAPEQRADMPAFEEPESVPALQVEGLDAGYGRGADGRPAKMVLRSVDLTVGHGQTMGVVGESGCGKSTLARVIAGLLPAASGEIRLRGTPLAADMAKRRREDLRKVQLAYQMPDTALNPRQTVQKILGRPVSFYGGLRGKDRLHRVEELLDLVKLPADFARRYPHELSGGQKQRVNLARALAANPEIILCDEVTSALDTIVGANVISLLERLQDETGVAFIFISHDLATVSSFSDEITVLYAGRVAEQGPAEHVLSPPFHPYTRLLISSVPRPERGWLEKAISGRGAEAAASGAVRIAERGCAFRDRCPLAIPGTCDAADPPRQRGHGAHTIACHRDLGELMNRL